MLDPQDELDPKPRKPKFNKAILVVILIIATLGICHFAFLAMSGGT